MDDCLILILKITYVCMSVVVGAPDKEAIQAIVLVPNRDLARQVSLLPTYLPTYSPPTHTQPPSYLPTYLPTYR